MTKHREKVGGFHTLIVSLQMMRRPGQALLAGLLIAALAGQGFAQQPAPSVKQLKEQISKMEEVDRDSTATGDVKILNQRFLNERRKQLQFLLVSELEALRKYQRDLGTSLSVPEQQVIANRIQELDLDLEQIRKILLENAGIDPRAAELAENKTAENPLGASRTPQPVQTTDDTRPRARTSSLSAPEPMLPATSSQADCYADAPPILVDAASAAAFRIVREGPGAIDLSLQRLFFFTMADAISRAEKDQSKAAVVRSIRVQQFMEETARTDKQTGASATSDGSTSALEKPSFVNLLAFAVEHGAIDKEVNGSSLTLSTSPYAIIASIKGDTSTTYKNYDFFRRVGISANFNIADQNNVLASARRNQLSEWSIRARITGDRSTRSPEFEDFWNREIRKTFEQLPIVLKDEFSALFREQTEKVRRPVADKFLGYAQKYIAANAGLADDAKRIGLQQELLCRLKQDVFDSIDSFGLTQTDRQRIITQTLPALQTAIAGEASALELIKKKIKEMNNRPLATFAYTNKRVAAGSDYSQFKFLYEQKTFSPMKIVANAGLSIYNSPDIKLKQQRLRDIAFALSLEGKAGRSPFVSDDLDNSQITFAFTGRYERMFENRRTPGRKADLAFAQFKLEIPFMSGMSFPFSVTYANATELIKEDHVRANFGFSLDADKLLFIKNFLKK